jgi:hypothetical protein
MQQAYRVFIGATSADLASYRQAVKEALLTNGILPVEQTNFPPDFRSVEQRPKALVFALNDSALAGSRWRLCVAIN